MAALLAEHLEISADDRDRFLASARAELAADRLPDPTPDLPAWPNGLPAPVSTFVGREEDLDEAAGIGARLLVITGPPGVGKTRFAIELAARLGATTPVRYAALAGITDPAEALVVIADTCRPPERNDRPTIASVAADLGPCLLVVDNLEQVRELRHDLIALLEAAPGLTVVGTSRQRLDVDGEHAFALEPLPEAAAVTLFLERARAVDRRTEVSAGAAADLCRQLDGLPLALELAAARLRTESVDELLASSGGGDLGVQRTWEQLTEEERTAFALLAVFDGGWTRESADAVLGRCGITTPDQALNGLIDHSLIRRAGSRPTPRFAMFEVLREFAGARLDEQTDLRRAAQHHHARHFLSVAEAAHDHLLADQDRAWLERLATDHRNVRAALAWASGADGDPELAHRLVAALGYFWHLRGHWDEGRRWAAALPAGASDAATAGSLTTVGLLAWAAGEPDDAALDQAVALADEPDRRAEALGIRGIVRASSQAPGAKEDLEASLAGFRSLGSDGGVAVTLIRLGIVAESAGDTDRAAVLFDESIERYEALASDWGLATARANRADVHRLLGEWAAADELYAAAADGYEAIGARWYLAGALAGRATVATALGDHAVAAERYRTVDRLLDELGMPMHPLDEPRYRAGREETFAALAD